jgi:hypothetical protein
LVFSLIPHGSRVPNNVVALVCDGWQILPAGIAAVQLSPFDVDAQCDYRWGSPAETLDLVSIRTRPDVNALLDTMYREGVKRASSNGLLGMMQALMDFMEDREFSAIDRLFSSADPLRLSPEYLVGLLRVTANYAAYIPSWIVFHEKVRIELIKRELPASEIMIGLE